MHDGFPIVLTADRTLTANYALLFDGMLAASQTTTAPPALFGRLLMPGGRRTDRRAAVAPLGLRRIEAALRAGGFSAEEVVVANEGQLGRAIGRSTKIIGISSGEPAGLGMNSSTMTSIAGGRIYPQEMFLRLIKKIHRLNESVSAKIVLGGPGAWQLSENTAKRKELGIDHLIVGYAEEKAAECFGRLMRDEDLPEVISVDWNSRGVIPPICGASTMGVVEISRGCGLGCSFCTIAGTPMVHLPPASILADIRTNVAAGFQNIAIISEDFFRYGADGLKAKPETLIDLVRNIRQIAELRLIQIDHANAVSVAQYDEKQLATLHDLLAGQDAKRAVWVNIGVETAAGELLRTVGGSAKINRDGTSWADFCAAQLRRLCRAGFFPMASLMIGLPGERDEHIQETLDWVQSLSDERISIFPVLHAPVDGSPPLDPRKLNPLHWRLIKACYRLNFRWVPWLYADNQAAGGVPMPRRMLLQLLGRGQMLQWKILFAWHSRRVG